MLDRPLALVALLALPVLLLLARRAATRRPVEVPSLFIWRRIGLTSEPPESLRTRADLLLWLRLSAAAAIAFGIAGPRLVPDLPKRVLHVLIDSSPSMSAFTGRTADALTRIEGQAASVRVVAHRSHGLDDLGSILARAGHGTVVAITDHVPEGFDPGERVRLVLVGTKVANAGFVSAWRTDDGFAAVVRNFSTGLKKLDIRFPGGSRSVSLEPGEEALVSGAAPGGRAEITLSPGDRFTFDDAVTVERTPAQPVHLAWSGPDEPRARLALSFSGVSTDGGREGRVVYRGAAGPNTRLLLAPPGERRKLAGSVSGQGGLAPEAVPPPGLSLGAVAPLQPGGTPILSDGTGPLAVVRGGRVEIALDPADGNSGWSSDPSFPVFMAEVARLLGARPAGMRISVGTLDAAESATRPVSAPADLGRLTPSFSETPEEGARFGPWLYLLGALLLAAHVILEVRMIKSAP